MPVEKDRRKRIGGHGNRGGGAAGSSEVAAALASSSAADATAGSSGTFDGDEGDSASIAVALFSDVERTRPVSPSTPNAEAWRLGRLLQVGEQLFHVVFNPPMVDRVLLVKRAIVGHAILAMPQVK